MFHLIERFFKQRKKMRDRTLVIKVLVELILHQLVLQRKLTKRTSPLIEVNQKQMIRNLKDPCLNRSS